MKQQFNPLFTLFFFLLTAFTGFAAENDKVTLAWKGTTEVPNANNKRVTIPTFSGASVDLKARLPLYSMRLSGVKAASFTLKNPVYVPFTTEEAKNLPKEKLKASPEISIVSGIANGKTVSIITFAPIRKNAANGQLEKLTSFEYTYTTAATTANNNNARNSNRTYKSNSVLSNGSWFKFGVTETGIHKIDRTFLQSLGLNPNNVDPSRIQVYGNGGGMLPQANSAPRYDDLVENAVMMVGDQNGSFGANDYILFYGQGPHTWKANAAKTGFVHDYNIYSDTTYYFLTVGNSPGRRVTNASVNPSPSAPTISKYNYRAFHEEERKSLLTSGREWYGEEFNSFTLNHSVTFPVSDLVPGSPVALTSSVLGISPVNSGTVGGAFTVKLNNEILGTQNTFGHGGGDYHPAGDPDSATFVRNLNVLSYNNSDLRVSITFNQMGLPTATGHLDYLLLNAQRELKLYSNQTNFRSFENIAPNVVSRFRIGSVGNPAETFVWDVTNPLRPRKMNVDFSGSEATFYAATDTIREFVVFTGSNNFYTPAVVGFIPNQNVHALNQDGKTDLVILTHPAFYGQAQRLANQRMTHDKLKVAIVTTTQVYNEFSSGAQDITAIRDMMKMVYDRKVINNTKTNDSLIYLLLMGDASYDYKSKFPTASKNRTQNNTNYVPVYESRESLSATETYSSEDYYGLLDDTEGYWPEDSTFPDLVDIGIGRIPANSVDAADVMVNKIIHYSNPANFGKWRNRVTLAADDDFHSSTEGIAHILKRYPNYNPNKVYLDTYKQISAANGQRSPDCAADFDRAVEQGSLIIDYVGHGGETGLAHEQIVTVNQINNWNNYNNLTFFVTATCEFGRYDDPRRNSAAELSILNPNGGAVGLITTTRPVYSNTNDVLNNSFFNCVFDKINGRTPRLGDIFQKTKNDGVAVGNRNFTLLCDPSMKLAYPQEEVHATSIVVAGSPPDTLTALSTVTISGNVTNANKQVITDFNGKVQITVYEKPSIVNTLGDQGTSFIMPISMLKNVLYDGNVTAKNGLWTSTFVVPKDINYNFGEGKISLYASSQAVDANGSKSIVIGGSNPNIAADSIPPVIALFMDNESFVFGGLTGNHPLLIAHLSDDNGINTAGLGIGHEITATLDGDKENVKILNEYYTSDLDSFRSGKVRFQFKNLKNGPHELRLKAWDTHNNSSEKRIEFVVANSEGLALDHILNYPNPFSTNTTFHFDHNRAGEDLDIQIQIFTVSGKLIRTLSAQSFASKPHISEISWNGRDEYNDVLAKGVYIYKLSVRSARDGNKVSKYEKLVLLN